MSLKKEKLLDRGQYINDIEAFMEWNEVNAFIATEIQYADEYDTGRSIEAMKHLNNLVNYIIKLENKIG